MWVFVGLSLLAVFLLWKWRQSKQAPQPGCGRIVLVTGAASGVGRELALRLDELGYGVVASDVNEAGLGELVALRPKIRAMKLDVSSAASISQVVNELVKGGLFGVINVAGISNPQPVLTCSEEQMRTLFEVNTFGPIRLIRGLYPALKASKGIIINVTSISGKCAWPWQGFYASSKFALEGFSDLLRREISQFGIRTVVVEPGPIMTPMLSRVREAQSKWLAENPTSEYFGVLSQAHATQERNIDKLGWVAVSPREVAEVIARALGSPTPHSRYVVATPIFLVIFRLLLLLPDRWADSLMAQMTN